MGNLKKILAIIVFMIFLTVQHGCREIDITTTIKPDGSCERVITITGDSSDVFSGIYPFPVDSTWFSEIEEKTTDENQSNIEYKYTLRKTFNSVVDLNREYLSDTVSSFSEFDREIKLKRRFLWFITQFIYEERYKDVNPFHEIPVSDYLSNRDIKILFDDEDCTAYFTDMAESEIQAVKDSVETKFNFWLSRSILEEFYIAFLKGATQLSDSALTDEIIQSKKDILISESLEDTINIVEMESEDFLNRQMMICEKIFNTKSVYSLTGDDDTTFSVLNENFNLFENIWLENYTNTIRLPGLLKRTNAEENIDGNLSWEVEFNKFFFRDFRMTAKSRKINRWAVQISGVVAGLLSIGLFLTVFWKKKR